MAHFKYNTNNDVGSLNRYAEVKGIF